MSQQTQTNALTTNPHPHAATTANAAEVAADENPPSQVSNVFGEGNQSSGTNNIDATLYIDNTQFFRSLQDEGTAMTSKERNMYLNNKKKKKKNIKHGDRFYKEIYDLAFQLHTHYKGMRTLLPNMRKNDSECIHGMGKQLVGMRQTVSRGDIHSVVTDANQMDLSRSDEFKNNSQLSFLSQTEWLKWVLLRWGGDDTKTEELCVDDILRAIGILFMEDMREFIPYILSGVDPSAKDPTPTEDDPSKRLRLDSWNSKRKWTLKTVTDRFGDPDVDIPVTKEWNSSEARKRIDEKLGVGEYDKLKFNPNNPDRIKIHRNEKEVQTFLAKGLVAYNQMMKYYKMNTGGGDGHPVVVACWEDREPLDVVGYAANKECDVHLTLIHLWDKQHDFPLTVVKESGAPGGGVDDNDEDYIDFVSQTHGDEDSIPAATPTNSTAKKTPKQRTTKKSGTKKMGRQVQMMSSIQEQQSEERKEHLTQLSEVMKNIFQSSGDEQGDKIDMQAKLQENIVTTEAQLVKARKGLKQLKRKRRETKDMADNSPSNKMLKQKFEKLTKKATSAAKKVITYESVLENQLEQLGQLCGKGKKDDADDDIDLSDSSDDSDNDEGNESDD